MKICKCGVGHQSIGDGKYWCYKCGNTIKFDFSKKALEEFLKEGK